MRRIFRMLACLMVYYCVFYCLLFFSRLLPVMLLVAVSAAVVYDILHIRF